MKRILSLRAFAAVVIVLAAGTPAFATPIGSFNYATDPFFGPGFTIENFSDAMLGQPGVFDNVAIHLFDGSTDIQDLFLGDLQPGIVQTTVDLSTLVFDSAELAVTFSLPGSLQVSALSGLTFAGDFASFVGNDASTPISFTPAPVPEPSTLLLVGTAAALGVFRRRRQRR